MSKLILYHGSPEIIQTPVFGKGKSYNDYGRGFYCTEHLKLRLVRKSWGKRIRREAEKTYSESNLHCVFATDAKTDTPT